MQRFIVYYQLGGFSYAKEYICTSAFYAKQACEKEFQALVTNVAKL